MRYAGGMVSVVAGFVLAVALQVAGPAAAQEAGQERRIISTQNADYFGKDYDILKDVDQNICETACLADKRCQAFTLNTKSNWCFLKEDVGELRQAQGAVSGRVTLAAVVDENVVATREAELAFLPADSVEGAKRDRLAIADEEKDTALDDATIVSDAAAAAAGGNYVEAERLYREALKRDGENGDTWLALAQAALAYAPQEYDAQQQNNAVRSVASVNAYVFAGTDGDKAAALDLLAQSQAAQEDWRGAIQTYRRSVALFASADTQGRLDAAVAEHGFRVVENTVDNNAARPRICLVFSEELAPTLVNSDSVGDYLSVDGGDDLPVSAQGSQICVDGVKHGERYRVVVRPGILAASGETITKAFDLSVYVRDRDPAVRFSGNAYVLPAGGEASIPVVSINTDKVEGRLLRIGDRELARTIGDSRFLSQLASYDLDQIADSQGREVWKGSVDVAVKTNEEVTTAVPVSALVKDLEPGVYLLSAIAGNTKQEWDSRATQWFVLTDIGLSTFSGEDGFHVFARSLGTAEPLSGVKLELVALNNEVLGTVTTDAAGHARLAPGLLRGTAGDRPAVLMASASGAAKDFSFIDMTATPFDLTDRGVEGRQPAGALDVFLTSERGIYRTGDTAYLTGLVRDGEGQAVEGLTLTGIVTRPDGVEFTRTALSDEAAGGFDWAVGLPASAMRGTWKFGVYTDPKKPALTEKTILVDDFEPQKIDFDLVVANGTAALDPAAPSEISLDARYLFGAPAAGLDVAGEVIVTGADAVAYAEGALAGYRFGLADDEPTALRIPFQADATDENGHGVVRLDVFEPPSTTKPLKASINVRVTDASGRPVERTVDLPLLRSAARIGVKPLFEGAVDDGGKAAFDVVSVADDGKPQAGRLNWTLNRITTDFQWYSSNGSWNYEPVRRSERIGSGTVAVDGEAPGRIEMPVAWGGYELLVNGEDGAAVPASIAFDAGWYVEAKTAETPDVLNVYLDKARYAVGDKAVVHVEPRFAGKAQILVLGERVIAAKTADIPAGGGEVTLDVTRDWGPGAYVTAIVYRPMDIDAKRMPGRAIGLAHAAVDPGDRALSVSVEAPAETEPRQTIDVSVKVGGVTAGETAYLTLAAVDEGILNITNFEPPAPSDYYFGKRRLGVEIRDLYSRLIDRMQGAPGTVRSGGDAGASMISPPPMEKLVAIFSGVVTVGPDGRATVPLDLPDFNGSLKLMAVAWSKTGVGEANASMLVRDPIVVQVSQPLFLSPGDTSRIAFDVNHVEGPTGKVSLALTGGEGVITLEANARTEFDLVQGGRTRILVPVTADAIGDAALELAMTTPSGDVLTKSFVLPVRSLRPETVTKSSFAIAANGGRLTLGDDIFADFVPDTAKATLSITGRGGFDVAGVVAALDRYPYGCTEQLTSRALPLVYLDQTILAAGLSRNEDVRERVQKAIDGVLANQSSNGSFGLWAPDSGDLWLDAYVTDFLTRAQEGGYKVPVEAFSLAVDNLRNTISYLPDAPDWGSVAYAYYVLARNGRAAVGDLRYYADNEVDKFATPLAKAQLAASLALYGDRVRAETVFRTAVKEAVDDAGERKDRSDYGTALRDGAAVLTLGLEAKIDGVALDNLVQRVSLERKARAATSTQEDTWSLLAAHALTTSQPPKLTVDGVDREGAYAASFDRSQLAQPTEFANRGKTPVAAEVTVAGVPLVAPPAATNGYEITRTYYTLEGEPADVGTIKQGDRLVAVLEVTPVDGGAARLIVDDPLPAGFEIDNPSILRGGDVGALGFLELTDTVAHTEFRSDRFIAAVNKAREDTSVMRFAYIVRAVSPGTFVHPAAIVEDMYAPERRGQTDESSVSIVGPRS